MTKRLLAFLILITSGTEWVSAADNLSNGQTLYLPVYSQIWYGDIVTDDKNPIKKLVSALVSVRNTSFKTPIRIVSANYYSTEGKLLKEYVLKPLVIGAMGTYELFIERKESEGGSGANFVIQWDAATLTNPPVVEAVHTDINKGSYALTFTTTARPIQPDK